MGDITCLVLDVDGVIVGEKIGYNSPNPNPHIISKLKAIAKNIPVVLCTGKPHYSVSAIIDRANLKNPHITNGGSVLIDPIGNNILKAHSINSSILINLLTIFEKQHLYTELYSVDEYYIEKSQESELTHTHAHVLQKKPVLVDSLIEIATKQSIVKIMPITDDESGIPKIDNMLKPFLHDISIAWGLHPIANPHQFCGITAGGISKKQSTHTILEYLGIDPNKVLAIADSTSDWNFMEHCGFVATMENGQEPLKVLVRDKGGIIGGHVDKNGILPILDHFGFASV